MLATAALLLATAIGIPLGIYSGSRTRGLGRSIVRALSVLGISVPPLIGSLMLVFIAARTGWFPVGGMTSSGGLDLSWGAWLADLARHLPVPALALAIPLAASLERLQSQAIAAASQERFVAASRARGLERTQALLRHAWPVSLRPVLGLYGVMIASLFSGSFIVEVVTSWPGLGRLMFEALGRAICSWWPAAPPPVRCFSRWARSSPTCCWPTPIRASDPENARDPPHRDLHRRADRAGARRSGARALRRGPGVS